MIRGDAGSSLLVLGGGWSIGLVALAVGLPAMTTDPPTKKQDRLGSAKAWGVAGVVGAVVIGVGFALWAHHNGDHANADSDLGSAVVGAAVVGAAVFVLERRFGKIAADEAEARRVEANRQARDRQDEADRQARERQDEAERQANERGRAAARQHTQLLTALRDDLPGVDLSGRPLKGFYLRAKRMQWAELTGCDLAEANLSRAVLTNARMAGAVLNDVYARAANFAGADLTGASLRRADLRGADLSGGTSLGGADLFNTILQEADLRRTDMSGALNGPDCDFTGARYDQFTTWPRGVDPKAAGAVEIRSDPRWLPDAAAKAGDSSVD